PPRPAHGAVRTCSHQSGHVSVTQMDHIDRTSLSNLERIISEEGVVAGLRFLNKRAPHRFTGIYQFSPGMLLNVHLVDAFVPETVRGSDVATEDAYCVLLA